MQAPYQVKISGNARKNLNEIIDYISEDSPVRALNFVGEMMRKSKSILESFPFSGKQYRSRRLLIHSGYYIFYKVDEDRKEVWLSEVVNPAQYNAYKNLIH